MPARKKTPQAVEFCQVWAGSVEHWIIIFGDDEMREVVRLQPVEGFDLRVYDTEWASNADRWTEHSGWQRVLSSHYGTTTQTLETVAAILSRSSAGELAKR